MQVNFYLRTEKSNKDGLCPINCTVNIGGERIRITIPKVKSSKKHWNTKEQRIKSNLKNENYNFHIEFNEKIDELDSKLKNIYRHILLNKLSQTKETVLKLLNDKNEQTVDIDFFKTFKNYIETIKPKFAYYTIRSYNTTYNFLEEFESYLGYKINFENIDEAFYDELIWYGFHEKELSNNYLSKILTQLKTFLRWTLDRNIHSNRKFEKFKKFDHEKEVIYLTLNELSKLYNYKFDNKRLEYVRDTYCFGCFTSLRFSDIEQLKPSNIFEDSIKINIKKTKTIDHEIPLNKKAKEILSKYRNTLYAPLPVISGQRFNEYIKECCKIAEINTPTTVSRFSGSKRVDITVPKYELITSHTARKTFATNSIILGMQLTVLQNIMGHSKISSLKPYIKVTESLKQKEMQDTWDKI